MNFQRVLHILFNFRKRYALTHTHYDLCNDPFLVHCIASFGTCFWYLTCAQWFGLELRNSRWPPSNSICSCDLQASSQDFNPKELVLGSEDPHQNVQLLQICEIKEFTQIHELVFNLPRQVLTNLVQIYSLEINPWGKNTLWGTRWALGGFWEINQHSTNCPYCNVYFL